MNKTFHKPMQRQRGLTLISWLVIIAFLLFQGIMALNIVPVYITDSSVASVLHGMEIDANLAAEASVPRIREVLMKRLKINNVYGVERDNVKIKKAKGGYLVTIDYEPRGKLFGNLDFIVSFHHEATISSRNPVDE